MIELSNVTKSFQSSGGELKVLNIESLKFEEGKSYFLKGESGTGKTTLFNIISGLLKADGGEIVVDGRDVAKLDESERDRFRASEIGYVFQSFNLFKGFSALENIIIPITFGAKKTKSAEAKAAALAALEEVGLKGFEKTGVEKLSGGQQQRVAIARALINDPATILADEPTGNLDRKNGEMIMDLLLRVAKEREMTLIVISHDISMSSKFDEVLDIDDFNRIVEE
jgi:putative ABC transport system ATP-binding protein